MPRPAPKMSPRSIVFTLGKLIDQYPPSLMRWAPAFKLRSESKKAEMYARRTGKDQAADMLANVR